jgi:hypothetical protein
MSPLFLKIFFKRIFYKIAILTGLEKHGAAQHFDK